MNILGICENPDILKVTRLVVLSINIIKTLVPIILILTLMIKLAGAITKGNDDVLASIKKSAPSNIAAAVLIFLVPTFVGIVTKISFPNSDYAKCIHGISKETIAEAYEAIAERLVKRAEETIEKIDYVSALTYLINITNQSKKQEYEDRLEAVKETIDNNEKALAAIKAAESTLLYLDYSTALSYVSNMKDGEKKKEYEDRLAALKVKIDNNLASGDENGIFHGTKYNLTEEEIVFLANVGYCEQGKTDGVKAEVSLAANLFELQSKHKTLIDYVKKSGWFACATTEKKANQEQIEATRDVIVNGNRTMPLYINEHDCSNCSSKLCENGNRGDICKLVVDGVTYESMDEIRNHSNYIKNKTIIYNNYGSVYAFYSFPCSGCDPFGYTSEAYKERNNDNTQQQTPVTDSGILKIYYLGIGRYDGILITGNNTTLFIDGGYVSHGKKEIEFIKSLGITKIDGLIGSHLHNNHIDAHKEFIKELDVKGVYYGENPGECLSNNTCVESDTTPNELMNIINSKNIPMTILKVGKNIKIGNLTFDIVAPEKLSTSGRYRENNNSLNMILKFGKNKFYFSGDDVRSNEILNKYDAGTLDVDVFKWPHHGQSEVSNKLLDLMTPSYIIVPNSSIISQAQNGANHSKAKIYATGGNGYILAESDGNNLTVTKVNTR